MKKLRVLVIVMFIVNIMGINFVFAQGYTGTAFLRPEFEYQKDSTEIVKNFKEAFTKAFEKGDVACFKRDADQTPNKPAPQIVADIRNYISAESKNPNLNNHDVAQLINYNTTYRVVHREYWNSHQSAYIKTGTGEIKWWNPLNSSLFKDREEWVIASVYVNGVSIDFIANCGNPCRSLPGLEQFPIDHNRPTPPQVPNNNCCDVKTCTITNFTADPARIYTKKGQLNSTLRWTNTGDYVNLIYPDGSKEKFDSNSSTTITFPVEAPPGYSKIYYVKYGIAPSCPGSGKFTVITVDTRRWFGRNKAVWIPTAVAIIATIAVEIIKHNNHSNSYGNSWVHDSNTSPWPAGSGGNTPNGGTF